MEGLAFERLGVPDLEQRPRVQDVDAVAGREGYAQVVRDQDETHPSGTVHGTE